MEDQVLILLLALAAASGAQRPPPEPAVRVEPARQSEAATPGSKAHILVPNDRVRTRNLSAVAGKR